MAYDVEPAGIVGRGARLERVAVDVGIRAGRAFPWAAVAAAALAGALALLVASGELRVLQPDSYKALYDGRWIAAHGIPRTNVLSAVQYGRRWVDEQWFGELLVYEIWRVGGLALVSCVVALSIATPFTVLALLLRRRGVAIGWTLALVGYALLGTVRWDYVRAQDLAMPLFAVLVFVCLTDAERTRPTRRLVLLIPTLVVWANVHGSVMLAAALAVLYLLHRANTERRAGSPGSSVGCLALAGLAALAPLATPYGPGVLHYYLEFFGNSAQHLASAEGRPPAFPGGTFFAVYVPLALVLAVVIRSTRDARPVPTVLLVACVVTGISASRRIGNLPWHTYTTALLVAELAGSRLAARRSPRAVSVSATVLAAVVGVAALGVLATRSARAYEANTPLRETAAAAALVREHPCWGILADNLDAAALEWHDPWLARRIDFDSRSEIFSRSEMQRWATFELGRGSDWSAATAGDALLLGASHFNPVLVARLRTLPALAPVARDRLGIAVLNPGGRRNCP